ncbi:MAG: T9SS type A sorting domain-containing protein, partial [Salibacteraceae bacterium]
VPKKIIVEHFTNTRCSNCASRNPGFFNNFNNSDTGDMIHLAIHPSSPYSSCILNQHNSAQNDDRTRYYNIFGSTPRLVINGDVISASTSYNSPTLFNPFKGQTSPVSVRVEENYVGMDSIKVRTIITTEATHNLGTQNLYVALAEDTVFYNAPNGEDEHYDVFRYSLYGNNGMSINVPANVGDSVVFETTVAIDSDWVSERILALAVLQNDIDKMVNQSYASMAIGENPNITSVNDLELEFVYQIYPNPVTRSLIIETKRDGRNVYTLRSVSGKQISEGVFEYTQNLNFENLPVGIYFITISNAYGVVTNKIIKTE